MMQTYLVQFDDDGALEDRDQGYADYLATTNHEKPLSYLEWQTLATSWRNYDALFKALETAHPNWPDFGNPAKKRAMRQLNRMNQIEVALGY